MRTGTTALQTILHTLTHCLLTFTVLAFVVVLFAAPTQAQLHRALDAPLDQAVIDQSGIDRAGETARQRAAALPPAMWHRTVLSASLGGVKSVSSAVTITVNTLDGGNDGTCGTDGSDSVQDCSLLEAVDQANSELDYDVIGFSVDGTIPIAAEVTITSPVMLDGTTAPGGAHAVRIDASGAGGNAIIINGTGTVNSEVRGLVIGQAQSYGIQIRSGATGIAVLGNYIGTDPDGQNLGNGLHGVNLLFEASDNVIGGAAPGEGNTIGFNEFGGVLIQTEGTTGNTNLGNYIGTDPDGQNLGNGRRGVFVASGASGNAIGGTAPGEGNTIGFNVSQGVGLVLAGTTDNAVLGNALFENGGLGIDLQGDGFTLNDADDADGENSPNKLQNYPECITSNYDATANEVAVTYAVLSDPTLATGGASTYPLRIEFFRADSDGEEGAAFLGTDTYAASDYDGCVASGGVAPCPKDFVFTPAASVTAADVMVATATDATGNTSEFSASGQPLPVELTAFTATLNEGSVRLAWQTASETDNAGFEIERSIGPTGPWAPIGFVDGAGTTSAPQRYGFTDKDVPFGARQVAYRLRQVDYDGRVEYSPEVDVAIAAPEALAFEPVFPNPARGPATLRFALPEAGPVRLVVYDVMGREVARLADGTLPAGRHTARFDGARLPSGVYLVRMTTPSGFTQTQRLTLVR